MSDRNILAPVPLSATHATTNGNHPTNGAATTSFSFDLRARYSSLKIIEDEKNTLIEDALGRYDAVCIQCEELLKQQPGADHSQCEEHDMFYQQQIFHFERLLNRDPFVLVLIDGSSMLFNEVFLREGEKGGRQAALLLKDDVSKWIPNNIVSPPREYKIMVKVYADFKLLAKMYGLSSFEEFARGFNSLCDFVDVVSGDLNEKLMDHFKLFLYNYHCHQLLLGCSHKKLDNYHNDAEATHRVTLLQSTPFSNANFPFKTAHFPRVFGNGKASIISVASNTASHTCTPALASSPSLAVRPPKSRTDSLTSSVTSTDAPADSWAKRASAAAALPQTSMAPRAPSTSGVRRNKKGQRLDPMLDFDPDEHDRVKKLKLCNKHYLQPDGCGSGILCHHRHDYRITASETKALRQISREVVCMDGMECDDPTCIYGHRCAYPVAKEGTLRGLGCINGSACRFPREMHGIKA